ncbi:hypothetical protein ACG9H7_00965 [Acinetobacter wanghuae]
MDMKLFVVPALVIAIVLLGFFVYKQSESERQQEIERVVSDANSSLHRIEANTHWVH